MPTGGRVGVDLHPVVGESPLYVSHSDFWEAFVADDFGIEIDDGFVSGVHGMGVLGAGKPR